MLTLQYDRAFRAYLTANLDLAAAAGYLQPTSVSGSAAGKRNRPQPRPAQALFGLQLSDPQLEVENDTDRVSVESLVQEFGDAVGLAVVVAVVGARRRLRPR